MARNATLGGPLKRHVVVMAGIVNIMNKRRTALATGPIGTVTLGAVVAKELLAQPRRRRQIGNRDSDHGVRIGRPGKLRTNNRDAANQNQGDNDLRKVLR
mgnify:CR=1 FL=1